MMVSHRDLDTHSTGEDSSGFRLGDGEGMNSVPARGHAHIGRVLRRCMHWRLGKLDEGVLCRNLRPRDHVSGRDT